MKIFLTSDLDIPEYALNANLDGYAINVYAGNILMGEGYNGAFMSDLRASVKKYGKPVNLALLFGMFSTNTIFSKYPFIEFVKKHHQGAGEPKKIKVPVPCNSGYLSKLEETVQFFADELKKDVNCYDLIEAVTITGINESTKEMRMTSQDWTNAVTGAQAFEDAANKWIAEGYTDTLAHNACTEAISIFNMCFNGKKLIYAPIPGKNSFPCINGDEFCLPNKRKDLKKEIILFGQNLSKNFYSQYSAFKHDTITEDKYVQANQLYYKNGLLSEFEAMINHARNTGVENLEVHAESILRYPSTFGLSSL